MATDAELPVAREVMQHLVAAVRLAADDRTTDAVFLLRSLDRFRLECVALAAAAVIHALVDEGAWDESFDEWIARWGIHVASIHPEE